jgi:undecaprenyl phosphate N,N'-diacetylbacillosamine 1-phosphate transferase
MYKKLIKPFVDVVFGIFLFLLLLPLFFLIVMLLFFFNRGQVFFIQERPGWNAKIFKMIKFKTMKDVLDDNNIVPSDEQIMTKLGAILRKLSLDELPQLINVLKGEMSFIGPRPLLKEYLSLYSDEQKQRHQVKPGITGWAQVNGRNSIPWTKKFELDIYYVQHLSWSLDLKIIFLTLFKIWKINDVSQVGHVSSEKFKGNSPSPPIQN